MKYPEQKKYIIRKQTSDDLKQTVKQHAELNLTENRYKVVQYYFDILEILLNNNYSNTTQ